MPTLTTEDQVREIFLDQIGGDGKLSLSARKIQPEDQQAAPFFLLKHPWNDATMALVVPTDRDDAQKLAAALSRIDLPENYSAILHRDTRMLEVFWTAFKPRPIHEEIKTRRFKFWWREKSRECYFGPASADALTLAKSAIPIASASHTEHRNITSFHYFVQGFEHSNMGEPLCFWVDCSDIADADLDKYLRTINLYMTYYDRETPRILIHELGLKQRAGARPRYVQGNFPEELVAGNIDPSVTSFWLGTFETRDPSMKYLLHYRLIEFLAMSHVVSHQRQELIGILRRPHLISSTESAAAEVAGLFANQAKGTDRIKLFVDETVRADKVWAVLEMNKQDFTTQSSFDGGFNIKPILAPNATFDQWKSQGPISLVDKLRAVRNCLAHGQDEGTSGVIHTTEANRRSLVPWINLIETVAAEAMLYSRRTYVPGDTR